MAGKLLEFSRLSVAFDRPRQPVSLGPGLNRTVPGVLLAVSLNLPRLLELPGVSNDFGLFLHKVRSLARVALSAGRQKRAFLQAQSRRPGTELRTVNRQFLLARSCVLAIPVGLEAICRKFSRRRLCQGDAGIVICREVLRQLATLF